jgi:hypothetical protein
MIRNQGPGVTACVRLFYYFSKSADEITPVCVILKDPLPVKAPRDYVMQGTGSIYP